MPLPAARRFRGRCPPSSGGTIPDRAGGAFVGNTSESRTETDSAPLTSGGQNPAVMLRRQKAAASANQTAMMETGRLRQRTHCRALPDHIDDVRAEFSLSSFSRTTEGDYDEMDRYCALMHQLSRRSHSLTKADQA